MSRPFSLSPSRYPEHRASTGSVTLRYAGTTRGEETDNETGDATVRRGGEPNESLPDYQPTTQIRAGIDR
ncbi:hypothetical protein GCM10028815_11000 [Mariniluteicoccus flavus]